MVNEHEKAASVELTDTMHAGFADAMDRVQKLGLKADHTLVDKISRADWNSWDASHENALVVDTDGLGWVEYDDEVTAAAA